MDPILRARLTKAGAAGSLAIAAVLVNYSEGNRYVPYLDTGGVLTVCRGHTGRDVVKDRVYSESECDAFQQHDEAVALAGVKRSIHAPLNKWQEAALIDFTLNEGVGALASSTMAKEFNQGDSVRGCRQLVLWVKSKVRGKLVTLQGLVTRRANEQDLCLNWK